MTPSRYDSWKRRFDVLVAGALFTLTVPLQAVVAIVVRRNLGSPILFRQDRPGKGEEIFQLVKFRTMRDVDDSKGLVSDDDRLTSVGRFLRATSLDELPTLWNVVRGDMSLVGPRPLLVEYLPRYSDEQRRRHDVRPGVTGLAQVSGRNELAWYDKFALDVRYVDERSLQLDCRILARTVAKVLRRDGISSANSATMEKFVGHEEQAG